MSVTSEFIGVKATLERMESDLYGTTTVATTGHLKLPQLSSVNLGPTDILVAHIDNHEYSTEALWKLREQFTAAFPNNTVFMMPKNIDLSVVTRSEAKRDDRFMDLLGDL